MAVPNDVSIAVAQKIVKDFFQTIMSTNRPAVISFYAHDAVLFWDGQEFQGHSEINEFYMNELPQSASFQIAGFDVQTVPQSEILTLLVVWGSFASPSRKMSTFHSSFCIDAQIENYSAVIKYHNFTTN